MVLRENPAHHPRRATGSTSSDNQPELVDCDAAERQPTNTWAPHGPFKFPSGNEGPQTVGEKANHHENIFDPLAFVKISVPNVGTRTPTPTPARINCHAVAKFTHPKLSLFYRKVSLLVPCYIQKIP